MSIDAMKKALGALEYMHTEKCDYMRRNHLGDPLREDAARLAIPAITALRYAITEAERQEPENFRERLMENARLSNELGYVFPQPAIPAGYALVPVEPTPEMIDRVIEERYDAMLTGKEHTFIDIYKAMLAAAPKPENGHD